MQGRTLAGKSAVGAPVAEQGPLPAVPSTAGAFERGFLAAAAFNIVGILVFTRGLTNTALFDTDPAVFSRQGCVLILIWGLAYAAQSRTWRQAPLLSLVFAIEKACFAGWWALWMSQHAGELGALAERDPMAAAFYGAYGLGDAAFMGFFLWAYRAARG